jgi:hypothetical protein
MIIGEFGKTLLPNDNNVEMGRLLSALPVDILHQGSASPPSFSTVSPNR